MTPADTTPAIGRPLLDAASIAAQQGDMQRADALYLQHLAQARDDAPGLRAYGIFCLRTGRAASACYLLYKANALHPGDSDLLNQLGCAQFEMKDFEAARYRFEAALAQAPDHAPANYGRALCLQREGAWADAIAAFEKALAAQPDAVPVLLHLADACHRAGDNERARLHLANAERIAPNDPALWMACGTLLRETGQAAQALQWIDRYGRQHPGDPTAALEKARCLRAGGDPTQAMRWLERLEKRSPGLPENSEEYGNCAQDLADDTLCELHWVRAADLWIKAGEFARADALLDRLLAAYPASATGWNQRGALESAKQRLDATETAWHQAIACDPTFLDASANLALLYEKSNRVDDATTTVEHALHFIRAGERQTGAIELHLVLCMAARRKKDVAAAIAHLDHVDTIAASDSQRTFAAFERGKLMDTGDDAPAAMKAFKLGNASELAAWQRESPGVNKYFAGIESMLELVGSGWLRQWKPIGAPAPTTNVAFLVGFPRSGTTLLNQVLDCHSAIQTLEEKPPTQKIMAAVHSMPGGNPHAIADIDALDVAYLRAAYFKSTAEHGASDPSKLIFDKFPLHINVAGLLHRVFPQARFVLALRHPCDVVLSCFMQQFRINSAMANFCTLADTVALYTRTMDLWQMYREQLPLHVHSIRYEDVVDDFDGQVRALCAFLDVPWEDGLRQFSTRALDRGRIDTPSYAQVSKPIYREARYRWERYRDYLAPFLPALQPYIERFGYADSTRLD